MDTVDTSLYTDFDSPPYRAVGTVRPPGQRMLLLDGASDTMTAESAQDISPRLGPIMQILPIDLTSLVATILGISIVLVPVIGLTARFALKPVVEALAKVFEGRGEGEAMRILERRVELQEQEIMMLHQTVRSLNDAREFDRRLLAPEQQHPEQSPPPGA